MVTVDSRCRRVDDRTLVECRLRNDGDVAERVRLESRLDGAVHPPREDGIPAAGWAAGTWTGRVDAGACVGVGFATPAAPLEPPVRVESSPAEASAGRFGVEPSAAALVRELSDPRPPREGLFEDCEDGSADEPPTRRSEGSDAGQDGTDAAPPGRDWLDDVAERVDRLEALAAVRTLPEATAAVAATDGLEGARRLREETRTDAARLREVAGRAERLAGRIEAADAPIETLERLS